MRGILWAFLYLNGYGGEPLKALSLRMGHIQGDQIRLPGRTTKLYEPARTIPIHACFT
jgi:hypothetical protein